MKILLCTILIPMLVGIFQLFGKINKRNILSLITLIVNMILILSCCFIEGSFTFIQITDSLSISFMLDGLGKYFAVLVAFMWLVVGVYSFEYMEHEEDPHQFYGFYFLTLAALNGICFSGNYLTLYCFFELMTLLSMPLVLHSKKQEAIQAAKKYLMYSVFGASFGLAGFFFLSHYGFTTTFTAQGVLNSSLVSGNETVLLIICLLAIIGFGAKAGMMPLHAWLPIAHPVAPSCASSVLSGVITKAGVLAIIRVVYYQFGFSFIENTWVQTTWMILSLLTVLCGSMLAYKEKNIKKRFAYSTVSQVSYILFGLSCGNELAFMGAMIHVVAHSLIKDILFMSAGSLIVHGDCITVDKLKGIGHKMPITMLCFTIASLGLVGIPPFAGFVSKWYLAIGSLNTSVSIFNWLGPVVLLASALLTAGYLFTITITAFFEKSDCEAHEAGLRMLVPMVLCCVFVFVIGCYPKPLMDIISMISQGLF